MKNEGKKLVVTVRIDFEKQLDVPKEWLIEWQEGRYLVPPFNAEELREIIITPALRVGRFIEPISLVDEIIDEVIHYPGSLPLLSFTMQQLFEKCKENLYRNISKEDYDDLGGVIGALQSSANKVYDSLSLSEQNTMRNLMLRMVSFSGGETAGKRVLKTELEYDLSVKNAQNAKIRKILEKERLIRAGKDSYNQEFYEPSHDALVRTWKRMQDWIKEFTAENLLLHARLGSAVTDYERNQQDRKYLWHNSANLPLLLESQLDLNKREQSFVTRSRRLRRRNILTIWSIVLAVITGLSGLAIYANGQTSIAKEQTEIAKMRQEEAEGNLLKYRETERDRLKEGLAPLMADAEVFEKAEEYEYECARYEAIRESLDSIQKLTEIIGVNLEQDIFEIEMDTIEYNRKYKVAIAKWEVQKREASENLSNKN